MRLLYEHQITDALLTVNAQVRSYRPYVGWKQRDTLCLCLFPHLYQHFACIQKHHVDHFQGDEDRLTFMEALISLTASSSVGNWYIWTPLLTSSLMILILNLCSSLLEIVSALAIMGMMLTCGKLEKEEVSGVSLFLWLNLRVSDEAIAQTLQIKLSLKISSQDMLFM